MNKKEIFDKIGTIVTEIHEQYNYLSEHPGNLNELELELFLANSKFLIGHIEVFQKLNRTPAPEKVEQPTAKAVETESIPESKPEEKEAPEPQAQVLDEPIPEEPVTKIFLDAEPIEDEPKEINPGPALTEEEAEESVPDPLPEPEPVVQEVIIEEKIVSLSEEKPTEAVKEPEHVPTVNDLISAQMNQSTLGTQLTSQPVKDLKSIISLNDKLLFIKDLFNGYNLAYSEAIELLNRFDNFEAADKFLKANYAAKNNWTSKQSTADHFYELLNRRFGR